MGGGGLEQAGDVRGFVLAIGIDLNRVSVSVSQRSSVGRPQGRAPTEVARVSLQVDLRGHGAPHDRFVYHIPDAARDLGNRDLLLFIVRQAHEETAAERVAALRQLLVTRLREDWKVAVMRNGNPYKFDFRNGATTTALGDLVRTYQRQLPDTRQHQIFAGLSQDVLILSNRLPGIHPFLRSYVRKLARELP